MQDLMIYLSKLFTLVGNGNQSINPLVVRVQKSGRADSETFSGEPEAAYVGYRQQTIPNVIELLWL